MHELGEGEIEFRATGVHKMSSYRSKNARHHAQGFTLIACLLMLLLLSALAIGLMMMVTTESKVGGTDLQNNLAYHAAEGGIEKTRFGPALRLPERSIPDGGANLWSRPARNEWAVDDGNYLDPVFSDARHNAVRGLVRPL